ncbi:hypothetical protein AVEN_59385-1 [Araneus ventricosus]|uniref:Uncharacterized protein n=1 Tax=Araneus ventricosus TaxID=182803 RepID=A0A4Y2LI46_ARAVE|nr:hypothetical protein AVEN_59385-1 [Araneus ventricosus]
MRSRYLSRYLPLHIFLSRKREALFRRRVAWPNLESLQFLTCGLWSVEFEQSRRSKAPGFIYKHLGCARVNGCTDAVWPPSLPV